MHSFQAEWALKIVMLGVFVAAVHFALKIGEYAVRGLF